jgi:ABC-type glycerol-3-phosphate transport system permease component
MITSHPLPKKSLLIGVLLIGSIIFALPYVNMVSTSIKMDEEMGAEHFSIFPKRPIPRLTSPYVQTDTGHEIKRPVDLDRAAWDAFNGPFRTLIRKAVDDWWGGQPIIQSAFQNVDGGGRSAEVDALTEVVGSVVLARISDTARKQGARAMLDEVPRLASPDKIQDAFDEFMPRFALGDVTVRLAPKSTSPDTAASDYPKRLAGSGNDWLAATPNAAITPLAPPAIKKGQEAALFSYHSPDRSPITATLIPNYQITRSPDYQIASTQDSAPTTSTQLPRLTAEEAQSIDRIYIFYHPDQSWAKINLLITLNGRQYRLAEPLYAAWTRWQELEVRIPGHENIPVSGRNFLLLEDAGPAPQNAPAGGTFSVAFTLLPNNDAGAWYAKICRNYLTAFRQVPITRYIATSLSLAILTILLTTFGSSLSAYAFARLDFPGRDLLFGILLATMMIPGQVTMIPTFLIHKSIGWYNTLYPLWVHAAFGSAFFIFMMRQFFLSIPKELEDAARIDGCGFFGIYWHIMLPLIRPTIITVAIFAFMGSWNNFMGPLIYLNDERLSNLAFGLYKFNLVSGANSSLIMAGAFVMTLPIIAMFFLFQRYFIRGIAISGLGGR